MFSEKPLGGQVALVTGGGRGIGRAISAQLAQAGAKVAVNYSRSADHAESLVSEITAADGEAVAVCFDVGDESAVQAGIKEISEKLGPITILVNNAGIAEDGLLVRTKAEDWQKTIDINLSGTFYCAKAVAKTMMKARQGRIINISSVIGEMGNAGQAAYSASKAGVLGLTKSMARELGGRGITVNAVTPGYIATDMTSGFSDEQSQKLSEQIPLGRLGTVDDIAATVTFLASPFAAYITGQIVGVNGGMNM